MRVFCQKGLLFFYSSSKRDLLRAFWAENIFNEIMRVGKQPFKQNGQQMILVDHICQYIKNKPSQIYPKQQNVSQSQKTKSPLEQHFQITKKQFQKSGEQFIQMYDPFKGAEIPRSLADMQERISQAENPNNNQIIQNNNSQADMQDRRSQAKNTNNNNQIIKNNKINITFYPNFTTTPTIFNVINDVMKSSIQRRYLTLGNQGISKSMSYVHAWNLSDMSVNYRYNNRGEAKKLVSYNFLREKMSKIFYLSFKDAYSDFQIYLKLILEQCPEIFPELMQQKDFNQLVPITQNQNKKLELQEINVISGQDFSKILKRIRYLYRKRGIQCLFILDQINTLASRLKRYNLNHFKQKNNLPKQQKENLSSQQKTKIKNLHRVYSIISDNFPKILNSSSLIQEDILNHSTDKNIYTFDINHHTRARKVSMPNFDKTSISKIKAKEIYRFIWYQAAKLIPVNHEKAAQIQQKIISQCNRLAEENGLMSCVTPLSIFQAINNKFKLEDICKNLEENEYQFMKKVFINIQNKGRQLQKDKFEKYLTCDREQKLTLMLYIMNYFKENKKATQVPFHIFKTFSDQSIQDYYNKDFFQIIEKEKAHQYALELIVNRMEYEYIASLAQFSLKRIEISVLRKIIARTGSSLGLNFQNTVILLLQSIQSQQFIMLGLGPSTFNYDLVDKFQNFLGGANIYQNLGEAFEKLDRCKYGIMLFAKNQQKSNKQNKKQQSLSKQKQKSAINQKTESNNNSSEDNSNNPSSDFIYIRKNLKNKIQVMSFDLTVSKQKANIKKKFNSKESLFKQKLNFDIIFNQKCSHPEVKVQGQKIKEIIKSLYSNWYQLKQLSSKKSQKSEKKKINNRKLIKDNIQKLEKIFPGFIKNVLKSLQTNPDQKSLQTNPDQKSLPTNPNLFKKVKDFLVKKGIYIVKQGVIESWNHFVVCRSSHISDESILVPEQTLINGVKVSFSFAKIENINIQGFKRTSQTIQQYEVLQQILKQLKQ